MRDPHTGRFISNQAVNDSYYRKAKNRSANRYEPDIDEEVQNNDTKSTSTADSMIRDLLKRNPDLLDMVDAVLNGIPGVRSLVEEMELSLLQQHIDSQSNLYKSNRELIMALYSRFGFEEAAQLVARDILR